MTLHWWMHWFWVTVLLTLISSIVPNSAAPQSEEIHQVTTEMGIDHRHSERQNRAMYFPKTTTRSPPVTNATDTNQTEKEPTLPTNVTTTTPESVHPSIQWTAINVTDIKNFSEPVTPKNMTNITTPATPFTNLTESQNSTTFATKRRNLTRPDFVKDDSAIESPSESRIVTERPLSLETTFLQTRIPPNIESSRRVIDPNDGGMDTGAIAGISFAALVLAALAGSTAFVLYRRRYLNKPQTLNDKCSNPDSSGYLDDSTVRDNSEEMYSLDNDSFLNSLEAMTIQNYWTETVKHTKL